MRHGLLDAVERRGQIVVAASHQHLQVSLLGHGGAQGLGHLAGLALVPRPEVGGDGVVHIRGPLQLAAHVVLEQGGIRALVGGLARIVFGGLAGGVHVHAFETRIQAAHRAALVALEFLEPAVGADAQVGLLDVLRRKAREARQFLDRLLILGRG